MAASSLQAFSDVAGISTIMATAAVAAGFVASYFASRSRKESRQHQDEIRELSKNTKAVLESVDQQRSALVGDLLTQSALNNTRTRAVACVPGDC
jgi:hypothetical protein